MAIADKEKSFIISGTGDVLEPEEGIIGIGSGGNYALAAAKVLMDSNISAEEIAKKSIKVAVEKQEGLIWANLVSLAGGTPVLVNSKTLNWKN